MRLVRHVVHPAMTSTVRDLMSHSIVSGDPRRSLVEAAAEMRGHRISALSVVDDGAIVGIITERDLLVRSRTVAILERHMYRST